MVQAYDDNQTQMTLDGFLSFSQRFAKIKSRRLQKAVAGITGVPPFDHTTSFYCSIWLGKTWSACCTCHWCLSIWLAGVGWLSVCLSLCPCLPACLSVWSMQVWSKQAQLLRQ